MGRTKKLAALFLAATLALSATACGSSKMSAPAAAPQMSSASAAAAAPTPENRQLAAAAEAMDMAASADTGGGLSNSSRTSTQLADTSRKLIRRVYLLAETKDFDALNSAITAQIAALGGYMESSELNGRSGKGGGYEPASSGSPRYARMVVRIPSDKVDEFIGMVSEQSNVTARQESSEDVTMQYVDVESHKKALAIEQERLLMLLGKAEKIEDIIVLEERLSDVRYELESYESQLRTFDNLVDYSTVTLELSEVQRITPAEEKSMGSRMANGFGSTLYDMGKGFENFAVWFVVNLPYLVIWAIVITAAVLILRRKVLGKPHKVFQRRPETAADAAPTEEPKDGTEQ